jgi:type II secretory pathway component PulK
MIRAGREDGVALLLVLVVVVMTIGSVYAFARTTLLDVMGMRHRTDLVRARLLSESGVQMARRAIVDDLLYGEEILRELDTDQDPWGLLSRTPIEVEGGGKLRITIRDSGSRINLNGLVDAEGALHSESLDFLRGLLEKIIDELPGRSEEKFYRPEELAEAILDWVDSNESTRLGDEESAFYRVQGARSDPPNRPLFALDELSGIPEMDGLLLEGLRAYFTTYPVVVEAAGVNPNTAPPHVLSAIYYGTQGDRRFVDEDDVFRTLQSRREGVVFCAVSGRQDCVDWQQELHREGESVFPPFQFRSTVFTIESEGRYGEARARLTVVVDRSDPEDLPMLDYRWE